MTTNWGVGVLPC